MKVKTYFEAKQIDVTLLLTLLCQRRKKSASLHEANLGPEVYDLSCFNQAFRYGWSNNRFNHKATQCHKKPSEPAYFIFP